MKHAQCPQVATYTRRLLSDYKKDLAAQLTEHLKESLPAHNEIRKATTHEESSPTHEESSPFLPSPPLSPVASPVKDASSNLASQVEAALEPVEEFVEPIESKQERRN